MDVQIAEKELEVIKTQNKLKILKQELQILKIQKEGKSSIPEKKPQVKIKPKYKEALIEKKSELVTPSLFQEDERAKSWYVVHTGRLMGVYDNHEKIRNLPAAYCHIAQTELEAKAILAKAKEVKPRIPVFAERRGLRKAHGNILDEFSPSNSHSGVVKVTVSKPEWQTLFQELNASTIEVGVMAIKRNYQIKGVCFPGVAPEKIRDFLLAGLIDLVYPENNLKEFNYFPKLKQAMAMYIERCRIKSQDKRIYVKVISSIPYWDENKEYPGYHLLTMGVSAEVKPPMPLVMEKSELTEDELNLDRQDGICLVLKSIEAIDKESKLKVNYCNNHFLLISKFQKKINLGDLNIIKSWGKNIETEIHKGQLLQQ
ncbi:hypothetical protein RND81_10G192700 [Saponaria officinalis]